MGPLELLYYAGYRIDRAIEGSRRRSLPRPVLSIGNITTGGTGKTPATVAFAKEALRRGFRPCVLTRGYGGSLKGPVVVKPEMNESEAGDEPILMAMKLGDTPVVKCPDRYVGGMFAMEKLSPDLLILDDGFQHWRLYRDFDLVLVDSKNPFGGGRLLPTGRLREPLRELARADAIAITRCDTPPASVLDEIRLHNRDAQVFAASHAPVGLLGPDGAAHPLDSLAGQRVFAFAGIARPDVFFDSLKSLGAQMTGSRSFPDHYRYSRTDAVSIANDAALSGAEWIITTEKDIMRLRGFEAEFSGKLMSLSIEFRAGGGLYDLVFEALTKACGANKAEG